MGAQRLADAERLRLASLPMSDQDGSLQPDLRQSPPRRQMGLADADQTGSSAYELGIAAETRRALPRTDTTLDVPHGGMTCVRRPRLFSLVVILAAITLRGTYAAAVLPTVQAKAADCCRTRCDHGQSPPQSDRCCSVAAHAGDPL